MQFEPCPLYKHSINRVSERAIYIVNYKIRLLLFNIGLLVEFWCLALEHAIWIKNRVPTGALPFGEGTLGTAKTPFEAYTEKVPNMENLKAFGCAAYPKIKGAKPGKSFPRHRPGFIFVGMKGSSIWKLLELSTQTIEDVGDCDFDEYLFPFEQHQKDLSRDKTKDESFFSSNPLHGDRATPECVSPKGKTPSKSEAQGGTVSTALVLPPRARGSNRAHQSKALRAERQLRSSTNVKNTIRAEVFNDIVTRIASAMKAVHLD
jgi:hypothetical protein